MQKVGSREIKNFEHVCLCLWNVALKVMRENCLRGERRCACVSFWGTFVANWHISAGHENNPQGTSTRITASYQDSHLTWLLVSNQPPSSWMSLPPQGCWAGGAVQGRGRTGSPTSVCCHREPVSDEQQQKMDGWMVKKEARLVKICQHCASWSSWILGVNRCEWKTPEETESCWFPPFLPCVALMIREGV